MFDKLIEKNFDVVVRNHAQAIFEVDFRKESKELVDALLELRIPIEDLIGSGGGEAQSTQWLRRRLYDFEWRKHNFEYKFLLDGVERTSISHEIDHVRRGEKGAIALEIEWNNKDPFFDRDLENFHRLHAQTAISLGVIITRGESMQARLKELVVRGIKKYRIPDEQGMMRQFSMKERTARQREAVEKYQAAGAPFSEAFARQFVNDKFGVATTHWNKLIERIDRGVGNPCPLLLIGLPASIVIE